MSAVLERLRALAAASVDRVQRACQMAECIRAARNYHWVGLYDVTATRIAAIAWTGATPPAHPVFPATQGLSGAAVAAGEPVVAQDVSRDSRYLTTFTGSGAEAVFPVTVDGVIVGTIDVESERTNAFTAEDVEFLQACADTIGALWIDDTVDEL